MAGPSWDKISHYFKKGADVEISSDDDCFAGSWYAGTVVQPPQNVRKYSGKIMVEYKTLTEDKAGKRPLREELELRQVRPRPQPERRRSFNFSDDVDAYYNDGWWEGVITEAVAGEDRYRVFFRHTREEMEFKASQLRTHREWVYDKWVPPPDVKPEIGDNEETPLPAEDEANKEVFEHNFSSGELVEVKSDEEGYEGAWFAAAVVKILNESKYLIEYQSLMNDDDTDFLREEVASQNIRPRPPDIDMVDRFAVHERVDALYQDAWWMGVISKVHKIDQYSVYFETSDEELKFEHSNLRVHQEWINGKWVTASKAPKL